ncbi:MAG: CDP-diacylglycerol--glycerol-3-phosphate 3-phosphatidyltransferase [Candidatus Omnitrophica bacterium]|nr:CDP-diacylglycerol--glycerol-3-phosphate 3-phosphatidyltransferase [Candidatus Omnitrophota bacterium]
MNLPNKLTILRIVLTFIFMLFIFSRGLIFKIFALLIFSLASLTDFYDGHIARKRSLVTNFGKIMDPIADKLLVIGALLAFVQLHIISAWMVVLIISREMIITSLRFFAMTKGKFLQAEKGGKHKTVSQMVAIFLILGYLIFKEVMVHFFIWTDNVEFWCRIGIFVTMLITVALTLISGISYLWQNRNLIHD